MDFIAWLSIGLVAGGTIGALATWWISRARGGAVSVMQLKKENDKFRDEVTEHFVETARLINQMSDSYKQVFDHLSGGAEKLVDNERLAERLPPASGQEVRLSQFGAPVSASESKATPESASSASTSSAGSSRSDESLTSGKSSAESGSRAGDSAKSAGNEADRKGDKRSESRTGAQDPLKTGSAEDAADSSSPADDSSGRQENSDGSDDSAEDRSGDHVKQTDRESGKVA